MPYPYSKKHIATFDVDAQKCFTPLCPDELPVPGGNTIVDELNAQAELGCVRLGSKDAHPAGAIWEATAEAPSLTPVAGKNVDIRWPRHGVPGTLGFELLDGLPEISDYDFFVWKGVEPDMHPYGACFHDLAGRCSTGVIEFLRDRLIKVVLLGGLALEFCVKTTAMQLLDNGFHVVINLAATKGLTEANSSKALDELQRANTKIISRTQDLILS